LLKDSPYCFDFMSDRILFVSPKNPVHRVNAKIKARLARAQQNAIAREFPSAASLCARVFSDLKLSVAIPRPLKSREVAYLCDLPAQQLYETFLKWFERSGIPETAARVHAFNASQRVYLLRAFDEPDPVMERISNKINEIVKTFPREASDLECGRNAGDVLDPYILAAAQTLLYGGDFGQAISGTVAHKALMIIEGLLGHLHEEIIGEMRGNVRAPEPRGFSQEILDLETNPFPGADIVQPPLGEEEPLKFHQVKSKTGSAKGGDARRLGEQLLRLKQYYGGEIYYDALIGMTLRGHRSMRGVLNVAPDAVILVGESAFRELTRSPIGPQLLLRIYQAAFTSVAQNSGYNVETMGAAIVAAFRERADRIGEGFLEVILKDSTSGASEQQDSRVYRPLRRER
jgi:hypothetical protein